MSEYHVFLSISGMRQPWDIFTVDGQLKLQTNSIYRLILLIHYLAVKFHWAAHALGVLV